VAVSALEAALVPIIEGVVRRMLGDWGYFSSRQPPPGTSTRTFNERCRAGGIEGARKAGRTWSCSREAWFAGCSRSPSRRPDDEDDPTETIRRLATPGRARERSVAELVELALAGIREGRSRSSSGMRER
jgi:hypothetical protein